MVGRFGWFSKDVVLWLLENNEWSSACECYVPFVSTEKAAEFRLRSGVVSENGKVCRDLQGAVNTQLDSFEFLAVFLGVGDALDGDVAVVRGLEYEEVEKELFSVLDFAALLEGNLESALALILDFFDSSFLAEVGFAFLQVSFFLCRELAFLGYRGLCKGVGQYSFVAKCVIEVLVHVESAREAFGYPTTGEQERGESGKNGVDFHG